MRKIFFCILLIFCAVLPVFGCASKSTDLKADTVSLDDFKKRFNEKMDSLNEKIFIGTFEKDKDEDSYKYWFADAAMIKVLTLEKSEKIYSFTAVCIHEIVGIKTEADILISGMMALDPSIGDEASVEIVNGLINGEYVDSDGNSIYVAENSTYELRLSGANVIISGSINTAD